MGFEKNSGQENQEEDHKRKTARRLMIAVESMTKLTNKEINVSGLEHLKELPPERKVIVAVSHFTDLDIALAIKALGNDLDLIVGHQSIQRNFSDDPMAYLGTKIAGWDNFISIDWSKKEGSKRGILNFKNLLKAKDKIDEVDKVPVLAAFNPIKTEGEEPKPGYSVPYLAQLMDALILPVAVVIRSEKNVGMVEDPVAILKERPRAEVIIGKPFELDEAPELEEAIEIRNQISGDDRLEKFKRIKEILKDQSEQVVNRIQDLVPKTDEK